MYEIWWLLHAGRSRSFGLEPLRLSEIHIAFSIFGIYNRFEQQEYLSYIYAMEDTFFKWLREQEKPKREAKR